MNNKAQQILGFSYIMGIVMLVVAVLLITSFWETIQNEFDDLRDNGSLNCESSTDVCNSATPAYLGVGSNVTCYDPTFGNSHGVVCSMVSISPPLIFIMLILGAIGMLMMPSRQAPAYPGY